MTTYEVVAELCKQKGIAITTLEKELGFGRGYIGKFKTKGTNPTAKKQKTDKSLVNTLFFLH